MNQTRRSETHLGVGELLPSQKLTLKRTEGNKKLEYTFALNQSCLKNNVPIYNKDGKYYTPAFVFSSQKTHLESNQLSIKEHFDGNIKKLQEQTKIIYQPKAPSKYCQLCEQKFRDYQEHPYHLNKIKQCPFTNEIQKMANNFQIHMSSTTKKRMNIIGDQDYSTLGNKLKKKRIIQYNGSVSPISLGPIQKFTAETTTFLTPEKLNKINLTENHHQ